MRNLHNVLSNVLKLIPNETPYKHHLEFIQSNAKFTAPECAEPLWKEVSDLLVKYFPHDSKSMQDWQHKVIVEWTGDAA